MIQLEYLKRFCQLIMKVVAADDTGEEIGYNYVKEVLE